MSQSKCGLSLTVEVPEELQLGEECASKRVFVECAQLILFRRRETDRILDPAALCK